MPRLASWVAMITSQQPASTALPAKQRPDTTATSGTSPESRPNSSKARVVSCAAITRSVSPGRPPPPSANSTSGRRQRQASSNIRSFFSWFL